MARISFFSAAVSFRFFANLSSLLDNRTHLLFYLNLPRHGGVKIVGRVGPQLGPYEHGLDHLPQDHLQWLAVFFVHSQQKEGQHHQDHAEGGRAGSHPVFEQKEKRYSYKHRRPKANELPPGQTEQHLGFYFSQIFGDGYMGSCFKEGFQHGFNRFVGTLLGGLLVIPFYWLCLNAPAAIPWIPVEIYMTIGLLCVMALNLAFGATSAIQPGAVVYFVVMYTQPQESYVSYTIARIIDTGVGAMVSLAFAALFRSTVDRANGISIREAFRNWARQADGHVAKHSLKGKK